MATTSKGTPYVEAADLVSGYPTVSLNLAEHIDDNVAYNAATINAQTGTTYTFVLADATAGKLVTATNAASQTYTVPPESSVAWPTGSVLRILNQGAGTVTVAAGSGVTINGTPLTLAQYKGAAIQKTGTNTWTFIPFSGGVGSAVISSPAATGSYSSGGTTYNYYTFTASGTLTVDAAGFADVLVIGGGGGGQSVNTGTVGAGGGGAGAHLYVTDAYLPTGSLTVTVGGGGDAGRTGIASRLDNYYSPGGGSSNSAAAGSQSGSGNNGGSGGGGSGGGVAGSGITGLGNSGGTGGSFAGGGGGGAGAIGTNGGANSGGAGGAGASNSITGSAVTRCGGGGGGIYLSGTGGAGGTGGGGTGGANNATAGTINTGGGGGGAGTTSGAGGTGGSGGSGIVIVRVKV